MLIYNIFLAYFIFSVFPVGNSTNNVSLVIVAIYYVLYSTSFKKVTLNNQHAPPESGTRLISSRKPRFAQINNGTEVHVNI